MRYIFKIRSMLFVAGVFLFFVGLISFGCGSAEEAIDNINSQANCEDYCSKKYDCEDTIPTSADTDTCVTACRDSIEDSCGNENQAAANDQIAECVNMGCADFFTCMVFDAAPECFGFVN